MKNYPKNGQRWLSSLLFSYAGSVQGGCAGDHRIRTAMAPAL